MTGPGRFALGLLGGLSIALLIGLMRGGDDQPIATAPETTTTTTEAAAAVPWFEPEETIIGTTVLLPRELSIEDGVAFFDYDLRGIGPTLANDADESDDPVDGDHIALPERWILATDGGEEIEARTGPFDTSVRFEIPDGVTAIESIRLIGWRAPVPFGERIVLPIESGETAALRGGTVTIETVLRQSVSTIVQIDYDDADSIWGSGFVLPAEPGWRTSGRQGGGIQLIWEGDDAPETVTLQDVGFEMRAVSGDVVVMTGGT